MEWKKYRYREKDIIEARPYEIGENVSDRFFTKPPLGGDMLARNPNNHEDKWIIPRQNFEQCFFPVDETNGIKICLKVDDVDEITEINFESDAIPAVGTWICDEQRKVHCTVDQVELHVKGDIIKSANVYSKRNQWDEYIR